MEIILHDMEKGESRTDELNFGAITIRNETGVTRIVFDEKSISLIKEDGTFINLEDAVNVERTGGLVKYLKNIITS